ncbi:MULTISPECIES: discoidin domain-containing protein [unclassified Leifsonia]|uniref:discoidin domain-containing protein n=1 Tax=unclassified Leifsonia TaxID=2663824 RepID=UPI0008A7360B|nr:MULTISPECIES: discoidin domain-containing protein [unclassified Leifsonia]SEH57085.1 O-Glycosyl hydrolase [Leifsonia sp. CL154]SFL21765.1 O-Glycosyl hydrolase [Leifsonia sp. CL147]
MRKHGRLLVGITLSAALAVAAPLAQSVPAHAAALGAAKPTSTGSPVQVWLTDVGGNQWLAKQAPVAFQTRQTGNPLTIGVDDSIKYQKITGYGAALTDSAAYLINGLPAGTRDTLMQNLFSPSGGAGLSMVRSPMGATDFTATGNYSYDDLPAGETDPTLSKFSIQHDQAYIIPELKQARALNPDLKVTSTPWSPPGWMKTSGSMIGGTLLPEDYPVLADYFVKYVQAYAKAGVPVTYVTPQNEPLNAPSWPGSAMTPAQETTLINLMGAAFEKNHLATQIIGWDHNWDVPSYPESIYNDPTASTYAIGAGFHIYSGAPIYQTQAHNDYPGKQVYLTEATGGINQPNAQAFFHDALDTWIIDSTRNYGNGTMLWNLALTPDMGPLNADTNGIGENRGVVTIDPKTQSVTYNPDYYALAQVSKFVKPGAHRISSNTFGAGSINDVAFQNPDGSKVVVAYNDSTQTKTFSVADGTESFDYTLNAGAAATFTYTGPKQHGTTPAASVKDPQHTFEFKAPSGVTGRQTVTYDPELLPLQNSAVAGSTLTTYSLPVGASIHSPGKPLDRSGWKVSASSSEAGDPAAAATDGDLSTRWRTANKMASGDWYQVDLGSRTSVSQIVLDNTADNAFDSVFQYQVYVSDDGKNWGTAVADGNGALGKTTITFQPQTARYLRVVSTAPSFFFHWSIGDITVVGGQKQTGALQSPASVGKGLQLQNWTSPDGAKVTVVYNGSEKPQTFSASTDDSYTYTLPAGTSAMFTTRDLSSAPSPTFSGLSPSTGIPGAQYTITGTHFGATQGLGTVYFGGNQADITAWTDTSITAYVPAGLPSGKYTVSVNAASGQTAGSATYTVNGLGTPLSRSGWSAKASDQSPYPTDVLPNLLDGDPSTRYSSGTGQTPGQWLQVDMGQAQTFDTIALDSTASTGDYARGADVFVSSDGETWTKVAAITADGQQIQAVTFAPQTARYIKVVTTGTSGNWWSIGEFNVYTGGTATPVYGTPLSRAGWAATATSYSPWPADALPHVLDGDLTTRYSSGASLTNGMAIQLDMAQVRTFNRVVIDSGTSTSDYAPSADVYVSQDATTWTKVTSITNGQPVEVATFESQTARYLKIVSTGSAGNWWSIAEINVYTDGSAPVDYGAALPKTGWVASASNTSPWPNDALDHILDNDLTTRYSSGASLTNGMWVQVDTGQQQTFDTVVVDSGSSTSDYAPSADVQVSTDGTGWTTVASITSGKAVEVATFAAVTARYIRVVDTGESGSWWSIAELNVYTHDGTAPIGSTPLSRTGWTPTASNTSPWPNDALTHILDGDISTRYSSGASLTDGMWVQVDMGQEQTFDKVVVDSGSSTSDYAPSADVQVSTDGTNWTTVGTIATGQPVESVSFPSHTARYLRIVNTGSSGSWWSIAELNVYV